MKDREKDLINEIWKDIKGYEGLYQVSNLGRIKSLTRLIDHKSTGIVLQKEKIKKQQKNYGYCNVILCKNSKIKYYKVHRLVAQAFIPNPYNKPFINHKNEIREDNRVENLEWCDSTYNNNYGSRNKKIALTNSKEVFQYDLDGNFIKQWKSVMEVERTLKIPNSNICKCCKGLRNKAGGYIWKYE